LPPVWAASIWLRWIVIWANSLCMHLKTTSQYLRSRKTYRSVRRAISSQVSFRCLLNIWRRGFHNCVIPSAPFWAGFIWLSSPDIWLWSLRFNGIWFCIN
jgi:hypothetical protein